MIQTFKNFIQFYLFTAALFLSGLGFGQTTVTFDFSTSGEITGLNESSPGISLDSNIGFGSFPNSSSTNPAIYTGQLRLYQNSNKGGSIIIYASNGATITNVVINASGTIGNAGYTQDGGAQTNLNAGNTYTISGINATTEVEFFQRQSGSGNRIYVDSFEVTYMPSGPFISVSEDTITNLNYTENNGPSQEQNFTINGSALTTPITLSAPTNFEISLDVNSGYTTSLSLPLISGSVASTSIYVRLVTGLMLNPYSGTLTATSTGATQQDIALSGAVTLYCSSTFAEVNGDAITNVTLDTLNNDSGDAHISSPNGYQDFTAIAPTNLIQGQNYTISVAINPNGFFLYHVWVFVDWDGNLDFVSAIDEAYDLGDNESIGNDTAAILNTNITVPVGAVLGNTRMRVVMMSADSGDPDPEACDVQFNTFGETEDYTVNIISATVNTEVEFNDAAVSVSENFGVVPILVDILNPDPNPTTVQVALTSGTAADINNYTTQTLTFPANSSASQTLNITVTDDFNSNPDKTLVFTLQNPAGGNSAQIGTQDTFTLTILDNELAPPITLPYNQDFSDCATVDWYDFDEDGGDDKWLCGEDGNEEFSMNGFQGANDINWLISDFRIDFDAYSLETIEVLTRERYGNTTNEPNEFQLLYSTDFDGISNPTGFTWTALTFNPNNTETGFTYSNPSTETVDASEITGIAFLAFKYDMIGVEDAEDWRIQQIDITGQIANPNDQTTEVYEPVAGQVAASTQTAFDVISAADSFAVINFEVEDQGSGDALPTNITQMSFVPGSNNTADWSGHIQGITLDDNTTSYTPIVTISDTEIILNFSTPISIADGANLEFELGVYLNTTNIEDDSVLEFQINAINSGFIANTSGSGFANPFLVVDIIGNQHTIDVEATELRLLQQPSNVEVDAQMAPIVQVAYTDANGNIDVFFTGAGADISLSSTGSFDAIATTIAESSNGIATFNNLIFDTASTVNTITATDDSGLISGTYVSTLFDITPVSIIFEDFNDGDFTNNPTWINGNGTNSSAFQVITDNTIPLGNATTDGKFLASDPDFGDMSLAVPSTEVNEWQFSLATPSFVPSNLNYIGVVLIANSEFTGNLTLNNFQGYYLRIGTNGDVDPIELWRKTGNGQAIVGAFPLSPDFDQGVLENGLNIRVTRSPLGEFELFYSTGFQYSATPTTSAGTLTNNVYNTSSYFGIFQNFNTTGSNNRVYIDNIDLGNSAVDSNSIAQLPINSQPTSTTLVADVNINVTNSVEVFKFDVQDFGTSDGFPTEITQFRLVPGSLNTASWSQVIGGISIVGSGPNGLLAQGNQSLNINDNEIIVTITNNPQDEMTIADGTTREYSIRVFLDDDNITENEVIQFALPTSSVNWEVASGSSEFAQTFTGFEGNTFTIDVVGQKLEFISDASTTNINEIMSNVVVAFTDTNGNVDADYATDISMNSSGALIGNPVTVTLINGLATFNNLIHTAEGTSLTLTANSSGQTAIVSSDFNIIDSPELFITEVADPQNEPNARYVEIFNAGVSAINFSITDYFLVRQANGNSIANSKLAGSIPAKGYLTVAINNNVFNNSYGFFPDLVSSLITGNGNDAYFLSVDDTSDNALKNSSLDIFGELDQTVSDQPWFYEDSRAYRKNPTVKNANTTWTAIEWTVVSSNQNTTDMTPGYGDQDYIFDGSWNTIGLGDPNPTTTTTTGAQNIFIRSGSATLTADTTIGDLVVRSGATLTIEGLLEVTGDIVNEGTIIFNSTAAQTAVLGEVSPTTRVVGDGFETRRYFSAKRSFRYVSSSVNSTENIRANWQEGQNNTGINYPTDNLNGTSGFGTHITGTDLGTALGFDATATGNPSMFTWNNGTQVWDNLSNTNATNLELGQGHAILIRGDRSIDLSTNNPPAVETTLRSSGSIHIGDFLVTDLPDDANEFALIGNPYQAQVDMSTILVNHASGMNTSFMYVYDPTIGDRGGYATVDLSDGSNVTSVPGTSAANEFLQPNQAVFIETTTASPSLTFVESAKLGAFADLETFSDGPSEAHANLSVNLVNSENQKVVDGVKLNAASTNLNEVNFEDALKLWNSTEQFAIKNANQYLSIEKRGIPQANDSLFFYIGNYQVQEYQLELDNTLPADIEVVLVDRYLDEIHLVNQNQSTYSFSIDFNLPESLASDRFLIIFGSINLGLDGFVSKANFKIYPNPVSNGSINIQLPAETEVNTTTQISIFDVLGTKIMQQNIHTTDQIISIDISDLSAGVYLLEAKQGKTKFTQKMMVE